MIIIPITGGLKVFPLITLSTNVTPLATISALDLKNTSHEVNVELSFPDPESDALLLFNPI